MQPLQDDFRDPAAKDNSITNAATARSNLDAAITMRSAETELQSTIELRATASEIVAPTPEQKKLILNRKWKQPKSERSFFCHTYAIRSWFFVRFVTTHTETKIKWQRHSAVRNSKWKAKLLKHSNSDPDAHTQPSAVKRELIPLRQDLVCASSQHQQTLVQRTAQLPRHEGIVCGELRRPTLCRPTTYCCCARRFWSTF